MSSDIAQVVVDKHVHAITQEDVDKHVHAIARTCMALDTLNLPWIQRVAYTHYANVDTHAQRRAAILAAVQPAVYYVNEIIAQAGEKGLHTFTIVEGREGALNVEHMVQGRVRSVIHLIEASNDI